MDHEENLDSQGKVVTPAAMNPLEEYVTTCIVHEMLIDHALEVAEAAQAKLKQEGAEKFVRACRDACYKSEPWIFDEALKAIKMRPVRQPLIAIDAVDRNGINALQFACARGNLALCKILISSGANIDFKTTTSRCWSCLHFAVLCVM